jgi:dipeptidyl aminopeptidase/acylaminoacyl peptidase
MHRTSLHRSLAVWVVVALLAGIAPRPSAAAASTAGGLTLETIMADPDWLGNPPEDPYWSDDGRSIYYERKQQGHEERDLFRLDPQTGKSEAVPYAERGSIDVGGGELSHDRRWKVYSRKGDLYLKDLGSGAIRQLTRTAEEESAPHFLVGDSRLSFKRDTTVFVYDLVSGLISQPAQLVLEKDPAEDQPEGFLAEDQIRLFDILKDKKKKRDERRESERAEQKADPTRAPLPWYLGEDLEVQDTFLAPDGRWMLVVTGPKQPEGASKPAEMAQFVTESGNVEMRKVRSKVGQEKPVNQGILLLDLDKHEKHELDFSKLPGIHDDPLKDLREKAEKARKEKEEKAKAEKAEKDKTDAKKDDAKDDKAKKDDKKADDKKDAKKADDKAEARPVEVFTVDFSDDGQLAAISLHALDNKDRWIVTVDREHPEPAVRHRLTDPGWINWDFNETGWMPGTHTLVYTSEETGFSQLYAWSPDSPKARRLTDGGKYEAGNFQPSRDGKWVYYRANAGHPGIHEVWRVDVASGKAEQLTKLGGDNAPYLSPDESKLLVLHSTTTRHQELYLQDNQPGAEARALTQTHSPEYLAIDWSAPEIVAVPSTHTASTASGPVYSRVYTPKDFDPSRKYPAVMFVHGAGYLQDAHAGWSSYFHEFMFQTVLTQHGYVVLDMDYRGSAGYGRAWRTAIYRNMGHPEVEDLQDGVAWLAAHKSVDPKRVGVYGGSYGGFLTFMSMFREPDLFATGAALRPVTDWEHYNQEYTANILNNPDIDPEAYRRSSPIEFAEGLKRPVLICHGMVDDNVFFQDTVRLVQRLIELKKQNFETAVYPVEAHGFVQPTSWLDEYRRIFKQFERYVKPEGAIAPMAP